MAGDDSNSRFLTGLLVGVGAAVAALMLFELGRRVGTTRALPERDRTGKRLESLERGSPGLRERRVKRAGRQLNARIDRLRSSGL